MPVFNGKRSSGRLFLAIGQISVLSIAVWSFSFIFTHNKYYLHLYRRAYSDKAAHILASKLSKHLTSSEPTCLFVGASSMQVGIDEEVFTQKYPGIQFLNIGLGGGTIFMTELTMSILSEYRIKTDYLVIGVHPSLLKDRHIGIWPRGYLDIMGIRSQRQMLIKEVPEELYYTFLQAELYMLWPGRRAGFQLNRLIREGLFYMQSYMRGGERLPIESFERKKGDLDHYKYTNKLKRLTGEALERFLIAMESQGHLNPEHYGKERHYDSLRRCLSLCRRISPHLAVIIMPESSYGREKLSIHTREKFWEIIKEYNDQICRVIDTSDQFPDESFDYVFHLLPQPSREFSQKIALDLEDFFRN